MGPIQHRNVHRLVATGLSTPGYVTVALIMGLDNILDQLEGWSVDFGRERGRDPLLYYITIFGEPGGDAPWGWRFGGHHVSLHYTIIGGEVVASTPNFLGADPAVSPLLGPHLHRPSPPRRISAASCSGRWTRKSARGPWYRRWRPPIWSAATARTSAPATGRCRSPTSFADGSRAGSPSSWPTCRLRLEATLGVQEAHLDAMSFSAEPKGIAASMLDAGQTSILRELIGLLSRTAARRARRSAGASGRTGVRPTGLPLGGRRRARPAALLPHPGRAGVHRIRQQPARREPHPRRVAGPRQRLRRRCARPPLCPVAPLTGIADRVLRHPRANRPAASSCLRLPLRSTRRAQR